MEDQTRSGREMDVVEEIKQLQRRLYELQMRVVAEGMEMMGVSSVLYPALKLKDIIMANVVVIILGILTSLLPAWRASQ